MVSTRQWHQLTKLAEKHGWRIVAVGDGFQFSAVGRGGLFDMLTRTAPDDRVTQLDKVHRFRDEWEAEASLALRHGDADVVDTYLEHGRILHSPTDKTAIAAAVDQWLHYNPQADVGLFASSNNTVAAINTEIQKRLIQDREAFRDRRRRRHPRQRPTPGHRSRALRPQPGPLDNRRHRPREPVVHAERHLRHRRHSHGLRRQMARTRVCPDLSRFPRAHRRQINPRHRHRRHC